MILIYVPKVAILMPKAAAPQAGFGIMEDRMMKKKVRKISIMLALALMLGLMAGVTVNAGTVAPSGAPKVVDTLEKLGSTSTVYAGEITVDGTSEMTYLYSEDITNSMTIFDTLRSCLSDTAFSNLVPNAIAEPGAKGLTVSSAYQDAMSSAWMSAAAVAEQYFTGTVGTETSGNFYDTNPSYASKVDANYAGRVEDVKHPLDFNKSFASLLKTEVDSVWVTRDGVLTREDVVTFTIEETTVIYTAVNVTTDKSEGIDGKTQWMFGDTIDFNSASSSYQTYYNKVGMDPSSTMQINNGSYTVVYEGWYAPAKQHNIIFKHNSGGYYLHFKPNDFDAESPETPIGIRLVSGDGTKASPYLFELIYEKEKEDDEISYINTEGAGGTWTKGGDSGLTFRFSRSVDDEETFGHFTGVLVDGKELDSSNYTAKDGSVIIDLKPAYMETLSAGEHTLTALFDDGNAVEAKFTVEEKKAEEDPAKDKSGDNTKKDDASGKKAAPQTGDNSHLPLTMAILLLSLSGIVSLGVMYLRTRERNRETEK